MNATTTKYEAACRAIAAADRRLLRWQWDDYVGSILATFGVDEADRVERLLKRHFLARWDNETIYDAPPRTQAVAKQIGVRDGQWLFIDDNGEDKILFAAWWPWGNGETISLRIGLADPNAQAHSGGDDREPLVNWFSSRF